LNETSDQFGQSVERYAQDESSDPTEQLRLAVRLNPGNAGTTGRMAAGDTQQVHSSQESSGQQNKDQACQDKRGEEAARATFGQWIVSTQGVVAVALESNPPLVGKSRRLLLRLVALGASPLFGSHLQVIRTDLSYYDEIT
jgi:hypothetical protein